MISFALVLVSYYATPALAARVDLVPSWSPQAQDPGTGTPPAPTGPPSGTDSSLSNQPLRKRDFLMEVNFRGRYLTVPDSILDFAFFDEGDPVGHLPRPSLRAWSTGLEYVLKKDSANGIFYFEYVGSLIQEGYWDDVEEPAITTDGDYIVPDRFGLVTLGADYGYELHANDWLSFLFGGGLGIAIVTGQLTQWNPGANSIGDPECRLGDMGKADPYNAPAYERYNAGCGDDGAKRLPSVLPLLDINFSTRFNFSDRANLRLDGGLHDMLYVGMATGVVF